MDIFVCFNNNKTELNKTQLVCNQPGMIDSSVITRPGKQVSEIVSVSGTALTLEEPLGTCHHLLSIVGPPCGDSIAKDYTSLNITELKDLYRHIVFL